MANFLECTFFNQFIELGVVGGLLGLAQQVSLFNVGGRKVCAWITLLTSRHEKDNVRTSFGDQCSGNTPLALSEDSDAFFAQTMAKACFILAIHDFVGGSAMLVIGQDFFGPPCKSLLMIRHAED